MPVIAALLIAAGGPLPAPFDVDAWTQRLVADRVQFAARIVESPNSVLAAVARIDFGDATVLTVGSDEANQVRLDGPGIYPKHLRITAESDGFIVAGIDDGARFLVKDKEEVAACVGPSSIRVGRYSLRLAHQGFPAIIVFDPQSPHLKSGPRPVWFPPDPAWRVVAKLEKDPAPTEIVIQSTRGYRRKALKLGTFVFDAGGKTLRLQANRLLEPGVGENSVSVFFRDVTTGHESYAVGRYVEPVADGENWIIDFNTAYSPSCAYSEHFNCPIPPKANSLGVAIRAGEKAPTGH